MNKIEIKDNKINVCDVGDQLDVTYESIDGIYDILKIKIRVKQDTSLMINFDSAKDSKIDIEIEVLETVHFHLYENKREKKAKIQYKYDIGEQAKVFIQKFYDANEIKELNIIYLNGCFAEIYYDFRAISFGKQKYDMVVYHNSSNTKSNIVNKIIADRLGEVNINITSIVYQSIKDTCVHQNNRIVNLNNKKHTISPNLLIEENEIEASHSAHIGNFDEQLFFYLMSRGIERKEALNLLLKGFLINGLEDSKEVSKKIDQYWR